MIHQNFPLFLLQKLDLGFTPIILRRINFTSFRTSSPSFYQIGVTGVLGVLGVFLIVYYGSRQLILLSGVCGHTSALSCKKVSEAYIAISFVNLPC